MRMTVFVIACTLAVGGCTSAPPEMQLIQDAADAMGGAAVVQGVGTLTVEGEGQLFNLGQNRSPDSDLPVFEVTEYTRAIDFANGRWRQEQVRTATFPTGLARQVRQITAVDGDVAFNVNAAGAASRASSLAASDRRAALRHHPIGILQSATAEGATVANHRQDGMTEAVDVTTADGDQFTLYVDGETRLPTKVASTSYHNNLGDVTIETEFDDYQGRRRHHAADAIRVESRSVHRW